MNNKTKYYITLIIVIIMITVSIILRCPKENEMYNNSDATYHVLLTMKCYEKTPISVHKFLPIVSLGEEEDKNISWGACVNDKNGNYYYTSFSPAGFAVPYVFAKTLNLPINVYTLYAFNSIIGIGTLILMIYIFSKLFSKYINKNIIILFTAIIYLFQTEVMHSQGVIYWVQSVFQMLIAVQFILFLNYKNKKCKVAFFIMCLFMPYVEWTGYISNVAFAIIIFIKDIIENKKLRIKAFLVPLIIGGLTVLSFGIFSAHYLLNIEFEQYITALKNRFFARNITVRNIGIKDLLKGYVISYKYFIILITFLLITIVTLKNYRKRFWNLIKEYKYPLIFFTFIMLENVIMLEHAVTYTFDRLKFMYILILLFFIMLSTICKECKDKDVIQRFITIIIIGISLVNVINYKNGYEKYITKYNYELNNQIISSYIKEKYNHSNSVLCSNTMVRGYINLLFDRGIYENVQYNRAKDITKEKNKDYCVYITRGKALKITEVKIDNIKDNTRQKIYTKNNELVIENN